MNHSFIENIYMNEFESIERQKQRVHELMKNGDLPQKMSMPLGIQLELTRLCNLKCLHCYNRSENNLNTRHDLDSAKWLSIAEDIVSSGGVFQVIISGGEPLLMGDSLFEIMDVFHNDGCRFILISNGYLMDEEKIQRLKKYNFAWIQISIDGVDASGHDNFRMKEGSWGKAIRAAVNISNAGIPLKIASTIRPSELNRLNDYVIQAYQLGASAIILGDIMPSGRAIDNENLVMDLDEKSQFITEIGKLRQKWENIIDIQSSSFVSLQLTQATIGAIDSVIIRPNGDVRLDCIAPFVVGNVKANNFKEMWDKIPGNIWQHPAVQEYISKVEKFSGRSGSIRNYFDEDVYLKF